MKIRGKVGDVYRTECSDMPEMYWRMEIIVILKEGGKKKYVCRKIDVELDTGALYLFDADGIEVQDDIVHSDYYFSKKLKTAK